MQLTPLTYFIGDINIPGLGQGAVQDAVNVFTTKYEKAYLYEMLGYELTKNFLEGLDADTPETKWTDLKNGKEFTLEGKLYKWDGFVNDDKLSPIASYIYYWWMRDKASVSTNSGEVEPQGATNNATKMSRAWNGMVEMTESLFLFLYANKDVYSEWETAGLPSKINVFNL